ncbi:hypothetical protein Dimus_015225 [Dionaea muscipula]
MKLSLKLRDETHQKPLLRAKVPVTILGLPFLSGVVAGDTADLSFSLRTNFSSGPSFSFSYHPTASITNPVATTTATGGSVAHPFSVSLKSGIGLFGSPRDSPLVFSTQFNLFSSNGSNPSLTPSFSLLVKPQIGNFSLRKSTSSSNPGSVQRNGVQPDGEVSNVFGGPIAELAKGGFVLDKPLEWRDLTKVEAFGEKSGLFSGIFVTAKTSMPLTRRSLVNFRWGVNFAPENGGHGSEVSRPVLVLNKIGLQRVEEVKRTEEKVIVEGSNGDLELLKGMCGWMRREMDDLQRGNREIKQALEGIKLQGSNCRIGGHERDSITRRAVSVPSESASDAEKWRTGKSSVQETGKRESQKSATLATEMENELQRALKAASSSG